MRYTRTILLTMIAVVALVAAAPATGAARSGPVGEVVGNGQDLTVVTHNISGGNPNAGAPAAADAAIYHVRQSGADAATFQEVCLSQVQYLQQQMPDYQVFFTKLKDNPNCAQADNSLGNVVLVHNSYPASSETVSPDPSDAGSNTICAMFAKSTRPVRVCSIHVPSGLAPAARYSVINQLRTWFVLPWLQQGWQVAIGGDFNELPGENPMNPLYENMWEADQFTDCPSGCRSGRSTHQSDNGSTRKFDYLFFSTNFSGNHAFGTWLSGWVPSSKHRILGSTTPMY